MSKNDQYNSVVSYYHDKDKPSTITHTVLTGKTLRRLYVNRQWQIQVKTWRDNGIVPHCKTDEEKQELINTWSKEAEVLYPAEGDYRVKVRDDEGNSVPIGSEVEPIIDELQVEESICDTLVPVCIDRKVVFQICNSNSQIDDNFDIYLNGVLIGAVDLNAPAQVGSVFIGDLNPALSITASDFDCPLVDMVVYRFDPAILQRQNVLEMRNTQNNANSNAGAIGVRNYLLTGNDLSDPCPITDLIYNGVSGIDFTFDFEYTQCCN